MASEEMVASDLIIHPGEELADTLEAFSMTQQDLALRTGLSRKHINRIVQGKELISANVALLFERVLETPASFWINLTRNYELAISKREAESALRGPAKQLSRFPIKDMVRFGWISEGESPAKTAQEVLRFFKVASFSALESVWTQRFAAAYRKADGKNASRDSLAVWIQAGRLRAYSDKTAEFDEARLRAALPELRKLTQRIDKFLPSAGKVLKDAGVGMVMVPHPTGSYANGATYWLMGGRPVIQLSIRYRWCDVVIFTLFHEIGHILKRHPQSRVYVQDSKAKDPHEIEADSFAAHTLIPNPAFDAFLKSWDRSPGAVCDFAKQMDIHPSVVAGRIQKTLNAWNNRSLLALRPQYEWK